MAVSFTDRWNAIARESAAELYREAGVEPGDHVGYMLAMESRHDAVLRRLSDDAPVTIRDGSAVPSKITP